MSVSLDPVYGDMVMRIYDRCLELYGVAREGMCVCAVKVRAEALLHQTRALVDLLSMNEQGVRKERGIRHEVC